MTIKAWPFGERPREKLLTSGAQSLSDAELIAVLFGKGVKGKSAVELAHDMLNELGTLREVVTVSEERFTSLKGIGRCSYAQFQAAFEIFRRNLEIQLTRQDAFHNVDDTKQYLQAKLRDCEQEKFALLMLNSQHQLIAFRVMFTGTINSAAVYPRELIKQVMKDNAAAVILVHNHPSGIAEPSHADIRLTSEIKSAMGMIDVPVLDHFVVGDKETVSFAQRGLLS
ncbi:MULTISPECIES: RadC family protein [unclassified Alteromonas]|uniref:RadC family protein n=1 Tax=unclassified Alteromonas TaxID=2614992 RepID=UPI000509A6CC|nr:MULTISPECIES: DNA repair protein RadC [unclassified Alteromonas]